jgi:hypothetical protein
VGSDASWRDNTQRRDKGDQMAIYGYARVSTTDQDLTSQVEARGRAGCEVIREKEKRHAEC